MIELDLPYPPSVNTYWRKWNNRMVISPKGRKYREEVLLKCYENKFQQIEGIVELRIIASPPDKRRRDIDNILKALLDSLTYSKVWIDDSQVKKLFIEMLPADENKKGFCKVQIEKM